jgi:hypothetical protein
MAAVAWMDLDAALRGTGADPQALADERGITIVVDEDAAAVGAPCWWGTAAPRALAVANYRASGGTVSAVYVPRAAA